MRQSLAKFSESEASNHTPSLGDFTTTTPELKFSVHTGALKALIIANEFLERDLERALAADGSSPSIAHDGNVGFRHVNWIEGTAT